ncbi:pre-rRNA-processing protein esf1 [Coniochaeta pulveracea]|uniref:Pre-rRNA-processing protein esf1 n=1 Tax=Coniochaeta pulveracea TaxID=177199 RepID=A0A420YLY1_9PEZI|nr:pre-rRNA-processing protein esf1 [Coniochaeta pulveracea]
MPKDKKPRTEESSEIKDSRFANFETDPRFRLPSKKHTKTTLDKRFSRVLKDDDFVATAKVDRYGRKIKTDTKKKALQRLYEEEDKEEEVEVDEDELVQRELREADEKAYDPARGGGFSSSDDDESDEEEEVEVEEETSGPGLQRYRDEQASVEEGEVTNRIAIVNLDWDHIKSVDLFALFSSFVPLGGSIRKVSIYPSEFGKSRMQKEELEGPPKEIFQKKDADEDDFEGFDSEDEEEDSEEDDREEDEEDVDSDEEAKKDLIQEGDDQDFDSDALRTYQLDRLRYYYAVMECSDPDTAHKIYEATDGSEYLSSSNFLDLRFIPDEVTFDDEPRDECDSVPTGYKPVDFVTDALQHSKVKLTWDMHPEEVSRKEAVKKAFSGSRAEIAENDLKAYLASDSEGSDDDFGEEEEEAPVEAEEKPLSKKELARRKMRAALGLSEEPTTKSSKSDVPVGDMQITFTSALSGKDSDKKAPEEETTLEKYKRKERERKAAKKEKALAKRNGVEPGAEEVSGAKETEETEDLGFNDPFFTSEDPVKPNKTSIRKEERKKKREEREAEAAKKAAEKAQLELLMAGNTNEDVEHLDHFDMNEIIRAEKKKNKKSKKAKQDKETRGGLQEDFDMPVNDDRFKAVFESHEFAIDPSNPKFKATGAMKKLLEEGRKKRKVDDVDGVDERTENGAKKSKPKHSGELNSLVEAVKRKAGGK